MSREPKVVTVEVTQLVDEYVRKQLSDATLYENSGLLDESGIFSLHLLAADIYARGFRDGESVSDLRSHGERMRELARRRLAAESSQS